MRLICGLVRLDGRKPDEACLTAMLRQLNDRAAPIRPAIRLARPAALAVIASGAGEQAAIPVLGEKMLAGDVRLDEPGDVARMTDQPSGTNQELLVLAAMSTFGPEGLRHVLGDFAFASWDAARQELICGRDIFGVRPFFYVHKPGELFAFASFPRALHGSGIVPKNLNEQAVARHFTNSWRPEESLIADVARLPPAHFLTVSQRGLSIQRYFQFDRAAVGTRRCSPAEAAEELRGLIERAVACRLAERGQVGAHLSGGLDSTALAVVAARQLQEAGRPLHGFSFLDRLRNDITLEDESESVRTVLKQEPNIVGNPVRPPPLSVSLHSAFDADNTVGLNPELMQNLVGAEAERQGLSIILSGWGGDEAASFNGRGTLVELLLAGRWWRLVRELNALKRVRGQGRLQSLRNEIARFFLPGAVVRAFARNPRVPVPDVKHGLLSRAIQRRMGRRRPLPPENFGTGAENRWRAITSPHIPEMAESHALTAARYGFAFAFPLLDRRVVEFALSLPSDLFLRDGIGRRVFRDAMQGILPDRVRTSARKLEVAPSRDIVAAECKEELLESVDRLAQSPQVRRLLDVGRIREAVSNFPSPDQVYRDVTERGSHGGRAAILPVLHALLMAGYIDQHGSE